ncbi:hypothetical protein Q9290_01385 [Oceanimonas sp. CHS3-5]|uniref:hypothetical protein n=1 Tax=Oceanimonas sp. CHS3-5 TaxID=3068186 RepID=UPI00273F3B0B|nr:hypothetical protein [Oceanimonas sp. CHS3-5]MDP5290950.1 hypothetical protein [Oceanimonas sp. CHS3-5]
MNMRSADLLAKVIISIQALLIPVLLLAGAWLTQQGAAEQGEALGGPWLWPVLLLMCAAWFWLCRRAWLGYLSSEGMGRQWPFWVLVAVQLPSFPLGTLMGAGLIYLKLRHHPRQ